MEPHSRKLLQDQDPVRATLSPSFVNPDPLLGPTNGSTTVTRRAFKSNSAFDSSMALTALVLLTALFFMGFFSIYLRRFSDDGAAAVSRRRRRRTPQPYSSTSWIPSNSQKGLDPSAVRSMPLIPYDGAAKYPIDCVICLSEFEDRETVKLIPSCGHVFHPECIDTWLSSHVSCPICRSTELCVVEEVRLDVTDLEDDHDGCDNQGRSTTDCAETSAEEMRQGTPVGMRRACSVSSLGDRVVVRIQRSMSF